jgi:dTDP-4-amino-4,6-dideoxygalactose transaminase
MGGSEQEFVRQAFESNYIAPLGPMVDAFEREFAEYTGIPHCLALSSGTAATHLALREALQRLEVRGQRSEVGGQRTDVRGRRAEGGDRSLTYDLRPLTSDSRPLVLASTLTFIGSVTPATFEGCELRFIDCDRATWNMDPALLEAELAQCAADGRLPVAVIPTDLYGQCCDLPRIAAICDQYAVPVICDSAEAMGARYQGAEGRRQRAEGRGQKAEGGNHSPTSDLRPPTSDLSSHAGFDAWASVYSFNGNKIITTSGGGMLASHDKALIDHARKLSQQARDPAPWYEHTEIGFNYRMSNILAAIGRGQLQALDERVRRRREIFDGYKRLLGDLPGVSFMPEASYSRSNRWLTVILIEPSECGADTHAVREALEKENIEARPVWKPMHLQPVFAACQIRSSACGVETGREAVQRCADGRLMVSEELFSMGLCLPSGTAMTEEDVDRVAALVKTV